MHPILEKLPDTQMIPCTTVQNALAACISKDAEAKLRDNQRELVISEDNRQTLLRMLDFPYTGKKRFDGTASFRSLTSCNCSWRSTWQINRQAIFGSFSAVSICPWSSESPCTLSASPTGIWTEILIIVRRRKKLQGACAFGVSANQKYRNLKKRTQSEDMCRRMNGTFPRPHWRRCEQHPAT